MPESNKSLKIVNKKIGLRRTLTFSYADKMP